MKLQANWLSLEPPPKTSTQWPNLCSPLLVNVYLTVQTICSLCPQWLGISIYLTSQFFLWILSGFLFLSWFAWVCAKDWIRCVITCDRFNICSLIVIRCTVQGLPVGWEHYFDWKVEFMALTFPSQISGFIFYLWIK